MVGMDAADPNSLKLFLDSFFFSKENFYVSETLHRRSKFLCIFFNTIPTLIRTALFIPKLLCVCLDCAFIIFNAS